MQKSIIEAFPSADISLYIVWINRLKGDSKAVADQVAKKFVQDSRVIPYYDPEQRLGHTLTKSLSGIEAEAAWDIYLFYDQGKTWERLPPSPDEYMHQMTKSGWADPAQFYTGNDLVNKLVSVMNNFIDP